MVRKTTRKTEWFSKPLGKPSGSPSAKDVSGGHFNPAVSCAVFCAGRDRGFTVTGRVDAKCWGKSPLNDGHGLYP